MPEEEVSQEVTDDDLAAAAAEYRGEQVEEVETDPAEETEGEEIEEESEEPEQEEEELQEEPDEEDPEGHQERTNLGRKVRVLQDELRAMRAGQDAFLEEFRYMMSQNKSQQEPPDPNDPGDVVMTGDIDQHIQQYEAKKTQFQKAYANNVTKVWTQLGQNYSDEDFDAITKSAYDLHKQATSNPLIDGEVSFRKAEAAYFKAKAGTAKNPLEKNKGKKVQNLGGPSQTTVKTKEPVLQPLDAKMKKYAHHLHKQEGMKKKDVNRFLQEEGCAPVF